MKNKIEDLRNHLFATLEALQDKDAPMDIERAKAVADVARVVIDSAKVEVDMLKVTGSSSPGSGFFPVEELNVQRPRALAAGERRS